MGRRCAVVVLSLSVLAASGCSDGPFKRAVAVWAGSHLKPYARYVLADTFYATEADRSRELMSLAGLRCLLDEDTKQSTPEAPSAGCRCARPASEEDRLERCGAWAKLVGATPSPEGAR